MVNDSLLKNAMETCTIGTILTTALIQLYVTEAVVYLLMQECLQQPPALMHIYYKVCDASLPIVRLSQLTQHVCSFMLFA